MSKKNTDEVIKQIDRLVEDSKREDVFLLARKKLKEMKQEDYSIQSMVLVFRSRALGDVEVPVYID